jgi:hypothetical protein
MNTRPDTKRIVLNPVEHPARHAAKGVPSRRASMDAAAASLCVRSADAHEV